MTFTGSRTRSLLLLLFGLALSIAGLWTLQTLWTGDTLPLRVRLGSRYVSKLPFLIAIDQKLFEKYGLDLELRLPPLASGNDPGTRSFFERGLYFLLNGYWQDEILLNGITPELVLSVNDLDHPRSIIIGSTDCVLRAFVVARKDIQSLEELKGKRIGITGLIENITGYTVLELSRRLGWDPVHDIAIVLNGWDFEDLRSGRVDAIVTMEEGYALALEEGFPILLDTRKEWGDLPIGGNSFRVEASWMQEGDRREAARRFLKALVEATALFHQDRELAVDVFQRWNQISRERAEIMVDQAVIPRVPFPCYAGIRATIEMYDSLAMRSVKPEDFYDDSLLKELEANGFIERIFESVQNSRPSREPSP